MRAPTATLRRYIIRASVRRAGYIVSGNHIFTAADSGSRLATPAEARPLARELRRVGYTLTTGKRITRHDTNARRVEWNRISTNRPKAPTATA